ncbi:NUDIX domain-containing protein [Kitasatospora sp. GP82]|uniref:NUDIX domain-containing protein n=1 Tax=Kitasatospora sp. GP82 TaxID=3035089 RepID=UPI002476F3DD|nr:NUDIX domain-containing protein [Kitasatospora sp. GP82]MDH6124946.1 ADP-ribose pyrophosphatase YjhB (NUDIX family) [Kitasatospora sp. GP82]
MHSDIAPDEHDRIRMGCQALIIRPDGLVLLVKPDCRRGWILPGDAARKDEPPHLAAAREVREEARLDLRFGDALVVDWMPRKDSVPGLNHVFFARVSDEVAASATIPPKVLREISEIAWVHPDDIPDRCEDFQIRLIWLALLRLEDPSASVYHV